MTSQFTILQIGGYGLSTELGTVIKLNCKCDPFLSVAARTMLLCSTRQSCIADRTASDFRPGNAVVTEAVVEPVVLDCMIKIM